ncbi:hypothetical protein PENSPDRAFT_646377 [Peniophora sp. CONT]|nr:hypothetical protein PENSPDRAFT_646377 [Peniophora sp. CONT]
MGAPSNLEQPESHELLAASSPGTPEFFGSLLAYAQDLAPALPINRVVFQSVLLCILAGNRSLVLRTRDEDVALLANTTAYLLGGPLAYATHRCRIAPAAQHTPESLLSSLFLSTNKQRPRKARRGSAVRSRTFPPPQPSPTVAAHRLPALADLSDADQRPNSSHSSQPTRPSMRVLAPHALSDSAADMSSICSTRGEPPQALVVSGLEYTSAPCQRALLEVFQDGCVAAEYIGDGSGAPVRLPDGFICVYVCPFDPYERPTIHQSLLDKFSLSATVLLTPALRETYTTYLASALPPPPPAPGSSLLPRILTRLQELSTLAHTHLPDTAGLFLTRLFSAARHHPELDAALLGARARQDAEALARALRVLCGGERVGALVQRVAATLAADVYDGDTDMASTVDGVGIGAGGGRQVRVVLEPERASALSSPRRSGSEDKGHRPPSHTGLAPHADLIDDTSVLQREPPLPSWLAGENADSTLRWDLSEADIGTIAPRVLSHRLRVRNGPADEILASVVYHACGPTDPERELNKGVWKRRTVKDVLVQLFKEV